jgi:hypothetical protein
MGRNPTRDPIEIDGLNLAFGTQEKNNFVHWVLLNQILVIVLLLLVSPVLSRQPYRCIIKITSNRKFQTTQSAYFTLTRPLYVNDRLKDWNFGNKRIAGVSSFGVGGTNVHVVLEEFIPQSLFLLKFSIPDDPSS